MEEGAGGGEMSTRFLGNKRFPGYVVPHPPAFSFLHVCLLLVALSLSSATPHAHDYHVSVTQMQYNSSQKLFEVSIKCFTDDLEKGLSEDNASRRFTLKDNDANNPYVERFIRKHFALTTAQKKADIHYLGKEQEADATWIYLEIPFTGPLDNWRLQNTILMETFDDQVNMFNLKTASETKTLLFKKGKAIQTL
jgi:hypothetical protein